MKNLQFNNSENAPYYVYYEMKTTLVTKSQALVKTVMANKLSFYANLSYTGL